MWKREVVVQLWNWFSERRVAAVQADERLTGALGVDLFESMNRFGKEKSNVRSPK